ncbi:hypothetical protein [Bacillus velezensis]|uniref:hypothetical protein n=1 Tax=Bacillus velezensis TaxID=492670 RepID=UPI001CF971AE|nr:hypothetical protein [Bacillus velezensis]GJI62613.1 hypothetical protein BVSY1_17690 [Bacillus velezensis]
MAKLDGVKTLDMVNGEITKVAYGGAEYERVEGRAKEFGNVGDLVLNDRIHCDLTVGAFYEIVIDEDYCWETVRDDVGDGHISALYDSGSVLFRKVSACTDPSLEERVSSAEGEIEALKSDMATLKGEAEYKRIDADEAEVGDFVKFDDPPDYLTDEEYYEIDRFDSSRDPWITDDDGDEYDASNRDFVFYRKVSAVTAEAERLKVGDYAKVVREEWGHLFDTDDVIELIEEGYTPNFKARRLLDGEVWCVATSEVVRATDEEVAEAKDAAARAKFKRGDKVRLLSGGGDYPLSGFENDKIYEVLYNNFNHPKGKRIRIADSTERFGYATPDQLEILSEEEAAEIERKQAEEAKWAKIGRKVGEYKNGDVVRYDYGDNEICEVVDDTEEGRVGVQTKEYGICREKPANLRLITPVEARFDR